VQAISGELLQSEVTDAQSITPTDVFPPAVPVGLSAVPAASSIELAWERNTESDFAGYNVYRSLEAGPFEKVGALINAPTYSDRQVESGKRYRYAISSVDQIGNESERSSIVDITAQ
jgi:fibronectin type 3 domain-containing protein